MELCGANASHVAVCLAHHLFGGGTLAHLPLFLAYHVRRAICAARKAPPDGWNPLLYRFVERLDLAKGMLSPQRMVALLLSPSQMLRFCLLWSSQRRGVTRLSAKRKKRSAPLHPVAAALVSLQRFSLSRLE